MQEWKVGFKSFSFHFLTTISQADDHHHDEDEENEDEARKEAKEPSGHIVNIDQIIPIIDSILEQDDKVITINRWRENIII